MWFERWSNQWADNCSFVADTVVYSGDDQMIFKCYRKFLGSETVTLSVLFLHRPGPAGRLRAKQLADAGEES
jgi:hypothetical protein